MMQLMQLTINGATRDVDALEHAPGTLIEMLEGRNVGKLPVRMAT